MGETFQATPSENRWSRFWRRLSDFAEAMDTSEMEILYRRVSALEREVAEIKTTQSRKQGIPAEGERVG